MKKTLSEILDKAEAEEMENLLSCAAAEPLEAQTAEKIKAKVKAKRRKKRPVWMPAVAVAACLCLIVGAIALTGRAPSAQPDDPIDDLDPMPRPGMLMDWENYDRILWYDGAGGVEAFPSESYAEESPNGDDEKDDNQDDIGHDVGDDKSPVGDSVTIEDVYWNGITLWSTILQAAETDPNGILPIRATVTDQDWSALDDHVYEGRTYARIEEELEVLEAYLDRLYQLDEWNELYQDLTEKNESAFLRKFRMNFCYVLEGTDEDIADWMLDKFFTSGVGFDMEAVYDVLKEKEIAMEQTYQDLQACRQAYLSENRIVPDLTALAEKGYVVVSYGGQTVILVNCTDLERFAADVVESVDAEVLARVVFGLADSSFAYGTVVDGQPVEKPSDDVLDDTRETANTSAWVGDWPDDVAEEVQGS